MKDNLKQIEKFLNAQGLEPETLTAAMEAARQCIAGETAGPVNSDMLPDDLKDPFRRLVATARYQARAIGVDFNPNLEYMPTQGRAIPSTLTVNVRL
mgnify:CR=1 FL=1